MRTRIAGVLLAASLGACAFGPRAELHPLALEPRGAAVVLRTRTQTMRAELLAVQDTAIVVLSEAQRVTLVPYGVIEEGSAELGRTFLHGARTPNAERRERLRRISRYPQGVSAELLRALLAAYQQPELEVVRE